MLIPSDANSALRSFSAFTPSTLAQEKDSWNGETKLDPSKFFEHPWSHVKSLGFQAGASRSFGSQVGGTPGATGVFFAWRRCEQQKHHRFLEKNFGLSYAFVTLHHYNSFHPLRFQSDSVFPVTNSAFSGTGRRAHSGPSVKTRHKQPNKAQKFTVPPSLQTFLEWSLWARTIIFRNKWSEKKTSKGILRKCILILASLRKMNQNKGLDRVLHFFQIKVKELKNSTECYLLQSL